MNKSEAWEEVLDRLPSLRKESARIELKAQKLHMLFDEGFERGEQAGYARGLREAREFLKPTGDVNSHNL